MKYFADMAALALLYCCLSVSAQSSESPQSAPGAKDAADSSAAVANTGTVDSIVFSTGIKDRAPTGGSTEFGPQMQKVFCWTKISIQHAPFKFKHVWYNGDEKVLEVPLRLGYASGRLWSYKTVTPGTWKVDVVDDAGKVIGSGTFNAK
jgi:Protein of unknown function (DUF2914)